MLLSAFWLVILASVLAMMANLAGLLIVQRRVELTRRYAMDIMAFAAGVVVGGALLHFLPELGHHAPQMIPWVTVSFFGMYVMEHHFAPHFHYTEIEKEHALRPEIGLMTALGFGVHALFDGLVIGVGFAYDGRLGLVAALAVIVHKLPEGIATFTALFSSGHGKRNSTLYTIGVAAITPVAALASFFLAESSGPSLMGFFMALATGSLLYIGASDLLPEIAHAPGWRKTFLIVAGLGAVFLISLVGHRHIF